MHRRDPPRAKKGPVRYTIKSLGLDLKSAEEGKTWLLLPDGYRDCSWGTKYPLPTRRQEIQKIAAVPIPPQIEKRDCGCLYIRRAIREWQKRAIRKSSLLNDMSRRETHITKVHERYAETIKELKADARQAVEEVRQEATLAIASLNDLFALGRKGIEGQMKAYLANAEYQGEKIDKKDFQACFRMVTQAVKGLGLPSDQRKEAGAAVLEQVAKALRATQEAVAMAEKPTEDPEKLN